MPHRKRKPKNSPTKSNSDGESEEMPSLEPADSLIPSVISASLAPAPERKRTAPAVPPGIPSLSQPPQHLNPATLSSTFPVYATKSPAGIRTRKTQAALKTAAKPATVPQLQRTVKTAKKAEVPPPVKAKKDVPPVQRKIFTPDAKEKILVKDLSRGKEHNPVRLVSNVEDVAQPKFKYITARENDADLKELIEEELTQSRYDPCCTSETCGQLCEEKVCPCRTYSGVKVTYRRYLLLYQTMDTYDNVTMPIKECNYSCYCHKAKNKAKKGQISCYNRTFSKGTKVAVDIFMTPDRGWGVRSRDTIKEGEYIGEYVGLLKKDLLSDASGGDYVHGLGERLQGIRVAVDAELQGNYTRFINHSCVPNIFVAKVAYETTIPGLLHLCLFALRDIYPYEEILLDYGFDFWEAKAGIGVYCQCGADSCHHPEPQSSSESDSTEAEGEDDAESDDISLSAAELSPARAQEIPECEV
ncbi:putative Histone-lysine N-methyltransferase EHMT2 [Hypsibius exemplaris]|uniref:Histone-lysine N-methyltransferase EHMT2 n=1 Tax=Hypsibius exemplaris TaxID=2072580 RepID=A0A1W0WXA3_HYPEX|nr:putative Histone-lysine N-methyltransferase EHMT2 [Hypsibius exemplaris]